MKVLLVDDDANHVDMVIDRMRQERRGIEVRYVANPAEARQALDSSEYDVAVVDLLYRELKEQYRSRIAAGDVSLTGDSTFLVSGLQTLADVKERGRRPGAVARRPGVVVWTSMEDNRALHVRYAYQELAVRVYCAKAARSPSRQSAVGNLLIAIDAAEQGSSHDDSLTKPFLPDGGPTVGEVFFASAIGRGVWRALALGFKGEKAVAGQLGIDYRIANEVTQLRGQLSALDPGVGSEGAHLATLVAYAQANWEFFLDDTVMRQYPPTGYQRERNGVRRRVRKPGR
ncbi:hypothetical protein AB0P21_23510 [Kribbella sp. NPDC056861]|uniref:hypothetical protein n=1 Tax=Kribbella sp. NPDC056861 TaxID=3154857 RepID=UPI00342F2BA7